MISKLPGESREGKRARMWASMESAIKLNPDAKILVICTVPDFAFWTEKSRQYPKNIDLRVAGVR